MGAAIVNFVRDVYDVTRQLIPRRLVTSYEFAPDNLPSLPSSGSSASSFQIDRDAVTLDILTYNIEYTTWKDPLKRSKILSAIVSSNADVVCLQETNEDWEEHLIQNLCIGPDREEQQYGNTCTAYHPYYAYRFFLPPSKRSAGGSAILSRWPLVDIEIADMTESVPGSVFPMILCGVDLSEAIVGKNGETSETELLQLRLANVHLRPPLELSGAARLSSARTTGPVRIAEIDNLLQRQEELFSCPLDIIVGDFNEQDNDGQGLLRLKQMNGFKDALEEYVHPYQETHQWPFGLLTLYKRLDHILYRPSGWTCFGCGVMTGYEQGASDHQPVLARFVYRSCE